MLILLQKEQFNFLLEIPIVKTTVKWFFMKLAFRNLLRNFIIYCLILTLFIVQVTTIYDLHENRSTELNYLSYGIDLVIGSYCAVQLTFEINQMKKLGKEYFRQPYGIWNSVDLCAFSLVLLFSLDDLTQYTTLKRGKLLSACAVFFFWIKLFYFLRIFEQTEKFIRMIQAILLDSKIFLAVYILANIVFASVFYILDGSFRIYTHSE